MKTVSFALISLFVFCFSTFAQTKNIAPCPTLSVVGPNQLVSVGEKIRFDAILRNFPKSGGFEFVWSVRDGEIVDGQGTKSITVLVGDRLSMATLEILGLPSSCGRLISSETIVYPSAPPRSKKVGEFVYTDSKFDEVFFDEFIQSLKKSPDSRGYIFVGSSALNSQFGIEERIEAIKTLIAVKNGIANDRLVFVNLSNTHNLTHLFVVPLGAMPPNPDSVGFDSKIRNSPNRSNINAVEPCPIIWVNGPKTPFLPNSAQTFTAEVDRKGNYEIGYKWTVSGGEILEGQGTPNLKVFQPENLAGVNVNATVELIGLPNYCGTRTASETAPPWDPPDVMLLDEIIGSFDNVKTEILDNLVNYLKRDRNAKAEIIWFSGTVLNVEFIETESTRINGYLTKEMHIENERFTIRNTVSDRNYVQFWIVPAGAKSPSSRN